MTEITPLDHTTIRLDLITETTIRTKRTEITKVLRNQKRFQNTTTQNITPTNHITMTPQNHTETLTLWLNRKNYRNINPDMIHIHIQTFRQN